MSATLYEISGDLAALEELLTEVGGELPDEVAEAAIDAWLEETGHRHEGQGGSLLRTDPRTRIQGSRAKS